MSRTKKGSNNTMKGSRSKYIFTLQQYVYMHMYMHTKKVFHRHRSITPVVAMILLVGITIIAGAVIFLTVIVGLNAQDPIQFTVSVGNFQTTKTSTLNYDTKIDTLTVTIYNNGKRPIEIDAGQVYLNTSNPFTPSTRVSGGWTSTSTLILYSGDSANVVISTTYSNAQLTPGSTYIAVVGALPFNPSQASTSITVVNPHYTIEASLPFAVGPTTTPTNGPLVMTTIPQNITINTNSQNNFTVNLNVTNYGMVSQTFSLNLFWNTSSLNVLDPSTGILTTTISGTTSALLNITVIGKTTAFTPSNLWIYLQTNTQIWQVMLIPVNYSIL